MLFVNKLWKDQRYELIYKTKGGMYSSFDEVTVFDDCENQYKTLPIDELINTECVGIVPEVRSNLYEHITSYSVYAMTKQVIDLYNLVELQGVEKFNDSDFASFDFASFDFEFCLHSNNFGVTAYFLDSDENFTLYDMLLYALCYKNECIKIEDNKLYMYYIDSEENYSRKVVFNIKNINKFKVFKTKALVLEATNDLYK